MLLAPVASGSVKTNVSRACSLSGFIQKLSLEKILVNSSYNVNGGMIVWKRSAG